MLMAHKYMSKSKHIGSDFDDFLDQEGLLEETKAVAAKRVLVFQMEKIEQMALGHFRYLPSTAGFPVKEYRGLTIINCGLGSSMFNIVFGHLDCPKDSLKEEIQKVRAEFKGQPFAWWIPPYQDTSLSQCLTKAGFHIEAAEHAMICELKSFEDRSQRGRLHLKQVLSSAELEDFISVLEPYDATARLFYEKLSPLHLQGSEQLFVGYSEETPVTIGILFKQGETAGIFSLLTEESSRGQGFGTEMMRYLMSFAKKSGVTHVTLSASSDSGYRIYEHLGFKRLGQFECFECRDQAQTRLELRPLV